MYRFWEDGTARRTAAALMIFALGSAGLAPATAARPARDRALLAPEEGEIGAVGTLERGATIARAGVDTIWIADWSFENLMVGGCTSAGWTVYDNWIQNDGSLYWRVDNAAGAVGGITGMAAVLSKTDVCWGGEGYGNDWDYSLVLRYKDPPGAGTTATLEFDMRLNSEFNFDYMTVEADSLGLSSTLADLCANPELAPERFRDVLLSEHGDVTSHIGPLNLPEYGSSGTHEVYIRFETDDTGSAEDSGFPTFGPGLIVDHIVVTGALTYTENFEGSLNSNVSFRNTANPFAYCNAPWARLFTHITDNDACSENYSCAWLNSDPLRTAFQPNMAFGPFGAVVRNWLDDIFVSPWVSLSSTASESGTVLSFRRFPGNTFEQSRIVQGWRVRARSWFDNVETPAPGDSIECVSGWGNASSYSSLGPFFWMTSVFDMSPSFDPAAREIQVSFRVGDWQHIAGGAPPAILNPGPGPYTDRVRIGRLHLDGPVLSTGIDSRSQAQDAFPTVQNSLSPGEHFSPDGGNRFGTCAFSMGADLGINGCCGALITGDSIWINVIDVRGAGLTGFPQLHGAIVAGPHSGKAPAPYSVGTNGFFAVTAEASDVFGWFVDLDDTYFRGGDQLRYFWAASDDAGGFSSMPVGLSGLPVSVAAAEAATGGLLEVSSLPTITWDPTYLAQIAADPHGDLEPSPAQVANSVQTNCILYVQQTTARRRSGPANRTSFMYTLDRLGYAGHYDVYDVQGYGNTNNQLAGRANVAQCSGYAVIVQDEGRSTLIPNLPDGSNTDDQKIDQALWYRNYLAQGVTGLAGAATFWLIGESTAFQRSSNPLIATNMGLTMVVTDQGLAVSPEVAGVGSFTFASGSMQTTQVFAGEALLLNGGCPVKRNYDGAVAAGTAVVTHNFRAGPTVGRGAIIMNRNAVLKWNTVWMGFPWFDILDVGPPGSPELVLAGKILNGVLSPGCAQVPVDVEPPTTAAPPAVSALHPNVPNPFNPLTQISFDLVQDEYALLRVFDVSGREVRTLVDEPRAAGRHRVTWNGFSSMGERLASGVYFYRLDAGGFSATRKMLLLK